MPRFPHSLVGNRARAGRESPEPSQIDQNLQQKFLLLQQMSSTAHRNMPLVLPAPPPHPEKDKVDAGPVAARLGQLIIQLPSPDPLQTPTPNVSSHQKGTKSPGTPASPCSAAESTPCTSNICSAERGLPGASPELSHLRVITGTLSHARSTCVFAPGDQTGRGWHRSPLSPGAAPRWEPARSRAPHPHRPPHILPGDGAGEEGCEVSGLCQQPQNKPVSSLGPQPERD